MPRLDDKDINVVVVDWSCSVLSAAALVREAKKNGDWLVFVHPPPPQRLMWQGDSLPSDSSHTAKPIISHDCVVIKLHSIYYIIITIML